MRNITLVGISATHHSSHQGARGGPLGVQPPAVRPRRHCVEARQVDVPQGRQP